MAKFTRAIQKLFGDLTGATGQFGVFGSLAAAAPQYSKDVKIIQSLEAWRLGWAGAVQGLKSPAFEDMNSLFYVAFAQLAYLLQAGLPEWDTDTTYYINDMARVGSVVYRSLTVDNTGNNPTTDTNNWTPYLPDSRSRNRGWVVFNGVGGAVILNSYLITSVERLAVGLYRIYAPAGVSFENACVQATSGGPSSSAHHNNYATLWNIPTAGYVDIRTDGGNGGQTDEDTPYICVTIF